MSQKELSVEQLLKKLRQQGYDPVSWQIRNNGLTEVTVKRFGQYEELDIDQIYSLL